MQPASGIEDNNIVAVLLRVPDTILCDLYGVLALFAVNIDTYLLAEND